MARGGNENTETGHGCTEILEGAELVLLMLVHLTWTISTYSGVAFSL